MTASAPDREDALAVAALLALDPGLGGAVLRGPAGAARDAWLAHFRALSPTGAPWRRLPPGADDGRLIGGLELGAALRGGSKTLQPGLLAEADGGVLVAPMAERLDGATAARVAAALDAGAVTVERDGFARRDRARFTLVALDEGEGDERAPAALADRLAFRLDVSGGASRELAVAGGLDEARARLGSVTADDAALVSLVQAAAALGVPGVRAPLLALRAARAAAALGGRTRVAESDLALAARLVLAPRAVRRPAEATEQPAPPPDEQASEREPGSENVLSDALLDTILAATAAVLPADVDRLWTEQPGRRRLDARGSGSGGAPARRGRPVGACAGTPRSASDLHFAETLRAAAPWQKLRRRAAGDVSRPAVLAVRKADLRLRRFRRSARSTLIFVVDASGSAALHRLAEAKGAVELLLAEAYARRTEVALVAFRGTTAQLLLPPTRSLTRARRRLADLAGGGATPLASALETAGTLALAERAKGRTPRLVVLTDGRGNVALDGQTFRTRAETDLQAVARRVRAAGFASVVIDIAPRGRDEAERLAEAIGARHAALPYVDAGAIRDVAQALQSAGARGA